MGNGKKGWRLDAVGKGEYGWKVDAVGKSEWRLWG